MGVLPGHRLAGLQGWEGVGDSGSACFLDDALEDVQPPRDDDHGSTWNYDYLRSEVMRIAQARRYNLQETLVHAIFERVAAYRGVHALRIKSVKPDIYADAKGVGVEIASFTGNAP